MSTDVSNLELLRGRLLEALTCIRSNKDHDSAGRDFYFFLGLVSAATTLDVISYAAMRRLHELAQNASDHRYADLTAAANATFAAAAAAEQGASA